MNAPVSEEDFLVALRVAVEQNTAALVKIADQLSHLVPSDDVRQKYQPHGSYTYDVAPR